MDRRVPCSWDEGPVAAEEWLSLSPSLHLLTCLFDVVYLLLSEQLVVHTVLVVPPVRIPQPRKLLLYACCEQWPQVAAALWRFCQTTNIRIWEQPVLNHGSSSSSSTC